MKPKAELRFSALPIALAPEAAALCADMGERWSAAGIVDFLESSSAKGFAAADAAGGLLAFALCTLAGGEADLHLIAVHPLARSRGVGTALLRYLLQALKKEGAERVFLEVREQNLAARRLYEAVGFARAGRRKGFYKDPPEDALLYTLQLKTQK